MGERSQEDVTPREQPGAYAVVIASRDRRADLRRTLDSLAQQSRTPRNVIVVEPAPAEPLTHPDLPLRHFSSAAAGSATQRNVGLDAVARDVEFVLFLDDDCELDRRFAERLVGELVARPDAVAAGGNITNDTQVLPGAAGSLLLRFLMIHPRRPGGVSRSGAALMRTGADQLERTSEVDCLPAGCLLVRRAALAHLRFDAQLERLGGYAALEDLDFSLSLRQLGKLLFVPSATLLHFKSPAGVRPDPTALAEICAWNRAYVVHKHFGTFAWICFAWSQCGILSLHAAHGRFAELRGTVRGLLAARRLRRGGVPAGV